MPLISSVRLVLLRIKGMAVPLAPLSPLAPAAMRQRPSAKQVAVAQVLLSRLQYNMASPLFLHILLRVS